MSSKRIQQLHVLLSAHTWRKLIAIAKRDRRTVSEVVRMLIEGAK